MALILTIGSLAAFVSGMAQSCLGFGMALIMAPCIMLLIEPMAVVPTVLLLSALNTFIIAANSQHLIRWSLLFPLAIGGVIGFTLGIQALLMLDPSIIRLFVGILVLLFTGFLWSGWRRPLPETPWTLGPVGLLSGFTGGATSISGPPVVLFLANQNTPRDAFRANLVCYFFIINCYGIMRFSLNGILNQQVMIYAAVFFPATLLGTMTGIYFGKIIPENVFRQAVFMVLTIMGAMLLYNSLRA